MTMLAYRRFKSHLQSIVRLEKEGEKKLKIDLNTSLEGSALVQPLLFPKELPRHVRNDIALF